MKEKEIKKLLETPFWISNLQTDTIYQRNHDDHDGRPQGGLKVIFDCNGDGYIGVDRSPFLRFRTWFGGGNSQRTRTALMILAEAIRLDNQDSRNVIDISVETVEDIPTITNNKNENKSE